MKKIILFLFLLCWHISFITAQKTVGINTLTPNPNAVLDMVAPDKNQGVLVPRLTTPERTATSFTAALGINETGLLVFDNTDKKFYYWNGTAWQTIAQDLLLTAGTGIQIANNTITNTLPDQIINLSGTPFISVTGTYPAFQIKENVSLTNTYLPKWNAGTFTNSLIQDNGFVVGIGGAPNSAYMLAVNGKFKSAGVNEISDFRLKTNIIPLNNTLPKILKLQGVTYNWRTKEFPEKNLPENTEIGVIAQDVEKIFPELVTTDDEGYKTVQYARLVAILIESIKEQQTLIEKQGQLISQLQTQLENQSVKKEIFELKTQITNLQTQINLLQQTIIKQNNITEEKK